MSTSDGERIERMGLFGRTALKGWFCAAVGFIVLQVPAWLPAGGSGVATAALLRPVAWLALVIGLSIVAAQALLRRPLQAEAQQHDPSLGLTHPSALAALNSARSAERGRSEVEPSFVDTIAVQGAEGAIHGKPAPPPHETEWGPRVFENIQRRRFDALCEDFYAQAGFSTSSRLLSAEGGVDIMLQSKHMPAPRLVRARHWQGLPVDVKEMRHFLTMMTSQGLQHGTYVTSSTFTPDASEFAKANGIQMQTGATLLQLIEHRTPDEQAALLAVAQGDA